MEEERVSVRLKALNLSDEEMGEQGAGRARRRQTEIKARQSGIGPQLVRHCLGRLP